MDVAEVNKVASRKRMSADVEKLREKVTQENRKIIKLKVAQDTAYWDLKEKLRQVETNHEKLQQNMLEVQMQYETVSGQYQDELRLRAETLNKLVSTREICTVLEEYSERLRDTLSRCKADQTALCKAYQQSGQVLQDMKTQQVQNEEKNRQIVENLQDKLKLTTEHHNQLLQYFSEEKQRATSEIRDLKEKLGIAAARSNELITANSELGAQLDILRRELEKKEESISRLQRDVKNLIQEFNSQANDMKNHSLKLEKELKETLASNESLKEALNNQETFTKSVCEQSNQLQEKFAALEDEQENSKTIIAGLEAQLQEAKKANDLLKNETAVLSEKNETMEIVISEKNEIIANSEMDLQRLTSQLSALDLEKSVLVSALNKAGTEAKEMIAKVQDLTETSLATENKIQEIENSMKASNEAAEEKIKELISTVESKDKELESKTLSVSNLMNEIKTASDSRSKLEVVIQKLKQELVEEKDSAGEREKRLVMRLEQLEMSVKTKEMEISKNMSVIMELRSDKERLNETIKNLQNKIDNIQTELTRSSTTHPRIEPEQDDNAVMLTPASKVSKPPTSIRSEFAVPQSAKRTSDSLFNFLSDDSADAAGEIGIDDSMALSEVKATMQNKQPRLFFKNKRHDKTKQ